jgi:hypothetical protein
MMIFHCVLVLTRPFACTRKHTIWCYLDIKEVVSKL